MFKYDKMILIHEGRFEVKIKIIVNLPKISRIIFNVMLYVNLNHMHLIRYIIYELVDNYTK